MGTLRAMRDLMNWLSTHALEGDPWLLFLLLIIPFVATLLLVPWLLLSLPVDYFQQASRRPVLWGAQHPLLRLLVRLLKNILGLAVILVGVAMLVLPGQGLLTIVLGFFLLEFPGKYRAERWLICQPPIHRAVNWLRAKRGREPLRM